MYMRPFTTSRITTVRLPPPRLPGGMSGSTRSHSESVRSLGYRNLPRSYRPRFFAVHMGDPLRIRPPPLNHKCFIRFNISPDGHLASVGIGRLVGGTNPSISISSHR